MTSVNDVPDALEFLEEVLNGGRRFPEGFPERVRRAVEAGDIELLAASNEDTMIGIAVVSYRPGFFTGRDFASIEDLYVRPGSRRRGVGRALLEAVRERCAFRGVSYVEVQVEDKGAEAFYARCGYEREDGVRVFARSFSLTGS